MAPSRAKFHGNIIHIIINMAGSLDQHALVLSGEGGIENNLKEEGDRSIRIKGLLELSNTWIRM